MPTIPFNLTHALIAVLSNILWIVCWVFAFQCDSNTPLLVLILFVVGLVGLALYYFNNMRSLLHAVGNGGIITETALQMAIRYKVSIGGINSMLKVLATKWYGWILLALLCGIATILVTPSFLWMELKYGIQRLKVFIQRLKIRLNKSQKQTHG